jgi:hypothetical protein
VFTARYEMGLYVKRSALRLKGLRLTTVTEFVVTSVNVRNVTINI